MAPYEEAPPVKKQTLFDRIARHLLTQNAKAVNRNGECRYRGPNGTKCAVGAVLPDKLYKRTLEGSDVSSLINKLGKDAPKWLEENHYFLSSMQSLHDSSMPCDWPERLRKLAWDHELSAAVVDKLRPLPVAEAPVAAPAEPTYW